ncbi:MAG: sensor domain-containing diguanylate cyclase [Acidimicrobiia bacterium]|nr:sensor domain-containing diguanylate cyclase [Acidimicrobiia bacterium]
MEAPIPADEPARLSALYRLDLLDRGPNEHFDRLTRLAAHVVGVPIALVSLVDADRQWFSSRFGLETTQTLRRDAFCAHAIAEDAVLVVSDARTDHRFRDNPLVVGPPAIRFYAGAPIAAPSGHRLGTLCVIDHEPRTLSSSEERALRDLAGLVERELEYTQLALIDDLTGLANRRAFVEAGTRLLALAQRRHEPLSVLYADVDGLKVVNDTQGHGAGDDLLGLVAQVVSGGVRASDLVARVGGDEFSVVLFGSDEPAARLVMEHLQEAFARANASAPVPLPLKVSIGLATAQPGEAFRDLVARADESMYRAKGNTRRD